MTTTIAAPSREQLLHAFDEMVLAREREAKGK